jgi:hypothetical protein
VCCRVFQTGPGFVRVTIKDDGGNPFHWFAEDSKSAETNQNGGEADICAEGVFPGPSVQRAIAPPIR